MEKENFSKGEIVIYTSADGRISLDAKLENESIWLTQEQMAVLFGVKRPAVTKHINNIYHEEELDRDSTCSILEHMGNDDKQKYSTKYYNLDMIIAVGYRVTSKIATHFRKWATNVLKEYLVKGYALNEKRLQEQREKFGQLKKSVDLLTRCIDTQAQSLDEARKLSDLLNDFARGLSLLDDFDHKRLDASGTTRRAAVYIPADEFLTVVEKMKGDFASDVFACPKDESFNSSVNQIYQTFDGSELYPSLEEKAAMLLYLIVKNHSFFDGNKRIGACCFLYFMDKNGLLYDETGRVLIDDATLFALTLLIAESRPEEMETVKKVAISILNRTASKRQ